MKYLQKVNMDGQEIPYGISYAFWSYPIHNTKRRMGYIQFYLRIRNYINGIQLQISH